MRIFDNPNHKHYGPVRRMWIILAQLGLLEQADAPEIDDRFGCSWDEWIAWHVEQGLGEVSAQQEVIHYVIGNQT